MALAEIVYSRQKSTLRPYTRILSYIHNLKVINAHEHLPSEQERVSWEVDVFTLFSHYTMCDLG